MKFLFRWALRILPILTIMKGMMSGGDRLGPMSDTVKVALTQYEVMEITKKVFGEYQSGNELKPNEFQDYVRSNYHNQYSMLARKFIAGNSEDFSIDIWGEPFRMLVNEDASNIKVVSAGIDGEIKSKDDIAMDFTIQRIKLGDQREARPRTVVEEVSAREPAGLEGSAAPVEETYFADGFDRDGFNREGYDIDGYDRNGIHRSEKEYSTAAAYE